MGGVSLPSCPPQSLEQSCPCRLHSTRCPPPLCINTTTFFHDPIPSLGREPRASSALAWAPSLLPRRQQWAGFPWPRATLGGVQTLESPPPIARCLPSTSLAPGRGSTQEAGRQGRWNVCGHQRAWVGWGRGGNWRCQLGGFLSQGVGVCRDGGVCPVLPIRL